MKTSRPSLSRPIELSSPEAVSTVRGGGLPIRACGVIVLGMIPPSRANGTNAAISRAYPNVPEATRIGLSSFRRLSSTCRSGNLVRPDGNDARKVYSAHRIGLVRTRQQRRQRGAVGWTSVHAD